MSEAPTVLLVEDDTELRDAVEIHLLGLGYNVVSTGDGLRAVQLADQLDVHLALVDLLIPGQSGFQVALDLKARFGDAVTVVILSDVASPAHRDYALAAGADHFVTKPFTASELGEFAVSLCPPAPLRRDPRYSVRIGA